MTIETFITTYGYAALLIGTFLEGETILILGGLAAHQGYLNLGGVILAAFSGSLMGDQFYFYLGRRHSGFFLNKRPLWQSRLEKARQHTVRYENLMILSFRFLYGLRTVTPVVYGMSKVSVWKFAILNAVGALVWAAAFGTGGYYFGYALEALIGKITHYEKLLIFGIILLGTIFWFYIRHQRRTKGPKSSGAPKSNAD